MEFEIKTQKRFSLGLNELWEYRELVYYFALRDVKAKYKQSVLAFFWALLQALGMSLLFSIFLGNAISSSTELKQPYIIFAFSGLVVWSIFSSAIHNSSTIMTSNTKIIKKVYFPLLIIPISSVLAGLFDFIIAFAGFILFSFIDHVVFNWQALIYFPTSILLTCIASIGVISLLASFNVKHTGFRNNIPYLILFLLFITPVIYPISISNYSLLSWILALNPMTAPLDIFRAAMVGEEIHLLHDLISMASSISILLCGLVYFRKTESYFMDIE